MNFEPVDGGASLSEIGEIKAFMRTTAPYGYLKCDGSEYSIASYPKLTDMFTAEFGSPYYFGGSGSTFKVPDLRGEFLRGTGTNSHTNCGSGANVGTHQDGTRHIFLNWNNNENALYMDNAATGTNGLGNADRAFAYSGTGTGRRFASSSSWGSSTANGNSYTSRPTNTSVLYCIRAY